MRCDSFLSTRAFLVLIALSSPTMSCGGAAQHCETQTVSAPISIQTDFLDAYVATGRFGNGRPTNFAFSPNGETLYFLRSPARSNVRVLYAIDVATGAERRVIDAPTLLGTASEEMTPAERALRERLRLVARGITSFSVSHDGSFLLIPFSGRLFVVDPVAGTSRELAADSGGGFAWAKLSPTSHAVGAVKDGNLFIIDVRTGGRIDVRTGGARVMGLPLPRPTSYQEPPLNSSLRPITRGASATITFGEPEFVAQEEMDRLEGFWWSPDATHLIVQRNDVTNVERLRIADPFHPEIEAESFPYPRPGKTNVDVQLFVVAATGGTMTPVVWDRAAYPYVATVRWKNGDPLVLVQNRAQTEELLLRVDARLGTTQTILTERDAAWLNLDQTVPHVLADGTFLWSTERDGSKALELRSATGELVRAVVGPEHGYRSLIKVDEDTGTIYVSASQHPSHQHVLRVVLASGEVTALTQEVGEHYAFIGHGGVWLHTAISASGSSETLMKADGTPGAVVLSEAEDPPFFPNMELASVEAGGLTYNTAIVRPRNFVATHKYPVLVYVYGGPHVVQARANWGRFMVAQWMADHGLIVVAIDGRGTPFRGREWERVTKNDVMTVPLADQSAALGALGARFPELDLTRVGIHGWSFGGYFTAMAVMRAPEVFHVGVAGAPPVDWRDYDTHYTERYMGMPEENAEGYERANVLTYANSLRRPLLVMHGTADDNVYFVNSLKLVDALTRAGRPVTFVPLGGQTHMVADEALSKETYRRTLEYMLTELHVRTP